MSNAPYILFVLLIPFVLLILHKSYAMLLYKSSSFETALLNASLFRLTILIVH